MQVKTRDVFGPLSRVWTYLQEVTFSDHENEDESIQVDLDLSENGSHLSSSIEHYYLP